MGPEQTNLFCLSHVFLCLVRTCFVGPKINIPSNETRPPSMVHSVDYPLDGGKLLRVEGQIRYGLVKPFHQRERTY